jgi:hypothetical protein
MADVNDAPLSSAAGLRPVWEHFREGGVAICPVDGGPMALAVDGSVDAYRFVCVQCGHASPWFEAKLTHLTIRGAATTSVGASDG